MSTVEVGSCGDESAGLDAALAGEWIKADEVRAELEYACKEKAAADQIETLLQKALTELANIMLGLKKVGSGGTAPTAPSTASAILEAELKEALDKLKGLFEDSDSEAGDLLNDLLDKLGNSPLVRQLKPVATAIDGFDFDAALEKLNGITA